MSRPRRMVSPSCWSPRGRFFLRRPKRWSAGNGPACGRRRCAWAAQVHHAYYFCSANSIRMFEGGNRVRAVLGFVAGPAVRLTPALLRLQRVLTSRVLGPVAAPAAPLCRRCYVCSAFFNVTCVPNPTLLRGSAQSVWDSQFPFVVYRWSFWTFGLIAL